MTSVASRGGRRGGQLTVKTIARLAGVAPSTVSRVLNGRSGVSMDTRRRVEDLLRAHEYQRPSLTPSPVVDVVFYELESHLAREIVRGVQEVVQEHDLGVGFTDVLVCPSNERTWVERLLARRPVGVITAHPDFTHDQHVQFSTGAIPVVALDPTGQRMPDTPQVAATNWGGAVAATRHLLDLGHRRIGIVGGPPEFLCARERVEACRAAMETAGITVEPKLVRTGRFFFEDGVTLGLELLNLPRRPTAVLCGNDLQALGVYEAARRTGLRIPDDLSVVGFDDIDSITWCGPPMTTVRQPFREMGAAAADLLLTLAAGRKPAQLRIEMPATLVIRGSTAAPVGTD